LVGVVVGKINGRGEVVYRNVSVQVDGFGSGGAAEIASEFPGLGAVVPRERVLGVIDAIKPVLIHEITGPGKRRREAQPVIGLNARDIVVIFRELPEPRLVERGKSKLIQAIGGERMGVYTTEERCSSKLLVIQGWPDVKLRLVLHRAPEGAIEPVLPTFRLVVNPGVVLIATPRTRAVHGHRSQVGN